PEDIFERPSTRFVADFMGFGNILDGIVLAADGNQATVRLGEAELHLPQSSGLAAGQAVCLGLRGERIQIQPLAAAEHAGLAVDVPSATSLGAANVYQVRLDRMPQTALLVRDGVQSGGAVQFPVGARVQLSWDPTAVRILRQ